ncbi:ENTP8 diphosphohydrolase, partial [Corythaeola cristata]|nr:ENTP8 diphosphohydrolase [Corythaeola cristata]
PCPLCLPQYGLVFDAGSTHTALYIYRWPADKENGTGIVSQVKACSVSGECGGTWLSPSSASAQPGDAGAGASVCRGGCPAAPAPAGWVMPEQNSTKAEQVLAEVAKAIGEYPVDFRGAWILTGNEEGSFGWITVNYLLETLVKFSFAGKWEHPQDTEVLGALDLGGASTQITFQPGVTIEDKNTSVFFRLYGTNYSLYTHSYLCYGRTQALKMLLADLHQVPQPLVLTVTGTGDPAACSTAIQKLFNFSCEANGTCGFNGVYQPPVRGQFFAFAGFYYTFHFLNLTSQQSLSNVNSTVQTFCKKNWTELEETFPEEKGYLHTYCSAAIYILTLLLDGYKFNEHTWSSIHFSQQV